MIEKVEVFRAADLEGNGLSVSCRKTLALISGDFAALMLFAAIGRASHGKSLDAVSVLTTAAPFLIGEIMHTEAEGLLF